MKNLNSFLLISLLVIIAFVVIKWDWIKSKLISETVEAATSKDSLNTIAENILKSPVSLLNPNNWKF